MTVYGTGLIYHPFQFSGAVTGQTLVWDQTQAEWTVDYPISVMANGTLIATRRILNISGGGVSGITDDPTNNRVNIVISGGSGGSGGAPVGAEYILGAADQTGTLSNARVLSSVNTIGITDSSSNGTLTLEVKDDTSKQKVEILNNGTSIGVRKTLNLIGNMTIADNSSSNRVDITIDSAPSAVKYLTLNNSTALANCRTVTAGTGINLAEDSAGKTLSISVPANTTNQKVHVLNDGNSVGTRATLNIAGTAISSITDNSTNDRIDIVINGGGGSGAPANSQYLLKSSDGSLPNSYVLTAGSGIALSTSGTNNLVISANGKVSASVNGGSSYQRSKLNFVGDVTITDSSSSDTASINFGASASYILCTANTLVPNAYVLKSGTGISVTVDNTAKNITVAATGGQMSVAYNNGSTYSRSRINFAQSSSVTVTDNSSSNQVDVAITAASPSEDYLVYGSQPASLPNSKVLTAGAGINLATSGAKYTISTPDNSSIQKVTIYKNGASPASNSGINFTGNVSIDTSNSNYTTVNVQAAPGTSTYLLYPSSDTTLTNNRLLANGSGILINDGGGGGKVTVSVDPAVLGVGLTYNSTDYNNVKRISLSGNAIASFNVDGASSTATMVLNGFDTSVQMLMSKNTTATIPTARKLNTDSSLLITDTGPWSDNSSDSTKGYYTLSVVPNTTTQQIVVKNNGTTVGTRSTLNLIPGTGIQISGTDDSTNGKVDLTVSTTPLTVSINGTLIGSENTLNFINNTNNLVVSAANNSTTKSIDVSISNDSSTLYYEQYLDASNTPTISLYNFTIAKLLLPNGITGTVVNISPLISSATGTVTRPAVVVCDFDSNGKIQDANDSSNYYTVQAIPASNQVNLSGFPSNVTCIGLSISVQYTSNSIQRWFRKMI